PRGVILAEHAVFIGFYPFSRTTTLLGIREVVSYLDIKIGGSLWSAAASTPHSQASSSFTPNLKPLRSHSPCRAPGALSRHDADGFDRIHPKAREQFAAQPHKAIRCGRRRIIDHCDMGAGAEVDQI